MTASRRPAVGLVLGLVLAAGIGLGFAARSAFVPPVAEPAPPPTHLVSADPRGLVLQPTDVPSDYTIYEDSNASDPGQTHPRARYSVVVTHRASPRYLTESGVNVYADPNLAAQALSKLLGVGKFGTELPMRSALGNEARLYAAKDKGLVIASALWRDRNVVAFIFVYNPYPDSLAEPEVDRLARANAYDDALGLAFAVEEHVKRA